MVWPAARPVEEVSVFVRWTSEGRPRRTALPSFLEGGTKVGGPGQSPLVRLGTRRRCFVARHRELVQAGITRRLTRVVFRTMTSMTLSTDGLTAVAI